jgi:hypothetical protein
VLCAVLHCRTVEGYTESFMSSLTASFPLLNVVLIVEEGPGVPGGSVIQFSGNPEDSALFERIAAHIRTLERRDKRLHQRFDWPLVGRFAMAGFPEKRLHVRSLSASGAFLEASGPSPIPGTQATVSIEFKDFTLLTSCEVLAPRPPAGNLPAGFGIRFTGLTEGSRKVVDTIVQDELIRILTEPGSQPREPAISP